MSIFFNVQTGLNDAVAAQIKSHLEAAKALMPFLRKLDPVERQKLPSIKDGRLPIAKLAFEYARDHHMKLMMNNDLRDRILRNYSDYSYLRDIKRLTSTLDEGLADTLIVVGSDCFRNALVVRDIVSLAAKCGVDGTGVMDEEISHLFTKGKKGPNAADDSLDDSLQAP